MHDHHSPWHRRGSALVLAVVVMITIGLTTPARAYAGAPVYAVAWGSPQMGQLGNNSTTGNACASDCQDVPVSVHGPGGVGVLSGVKAIAAGCFHSMVLLANGTVMAWGFNAQGELGDGNTTESSVPVPVSGPGGVGVLSGVKAIAGGCLHSMALLANGTVMDWGDNGFGELGDDSTTQSDVPVAVCALGAISCTPSMNELTGVKAIAGGEDDSLALLTNDRVMAWGDNYFGELGDGTSTGPDVCATGACSTTPMSVRGLGGLGSLGGVKAISGGRTHNLALLLKGIVVAWGNNSSGQLGNNSTTESDVPVRVSGPGGVGVLYRVKAIAAGSSSSLALLHSRQVMAWGGNSLGQLGNNSTTESNVPVPVSGPGGIGALSGVKAIALDNSALHSLALLTNGTVMAWGDNINGDLGDNSVTESNVPVTVSGLGGVGVLRGVKAIADGAFHSLAVVR